MSENILPINAFTPKMREIIKSYSHSKGYPEEYFITGLLAAASTSLGRSVTLTTGSYTAVGIMWCAIIGKPGVIKSEPLQDAFNPIKDIQFQYFRQYERDLSELETIKKLNPKYQTELAEPRKILLSDITPEALSITLTKNPKGCGIIYDELSGFIGRFNRYNSGADEQMFLSLFNGDTVLRSRVNGHGNAAIKYSFLSIAGTIQPGVLKSIFADKSENGFFDRWLMTYPDHHKKKYPNQNGVSHEIAAKYDTILSRLLTLDYDEYNRRSMSYSTDSYKIINEYQCKIIDIENQTENDNERSILAKMEIYLHRFSLLLQCLIYADAEYLDPADLNFVSADAANGSILLCDYYIDQAKKIRVISPVESLKNQWIDVYDKIPPPGKQFDRAFFVKVCKTFRLSQRSADLFLRDNSERSESKLFYKVNHGTYTKNVF